MKKLLILLGLAILLGLTACSTSPQGDSASNTGNSAPEEQGISSRSILQFIEAL